METRGHWHHDQNSSPGLSLARAGKAQRRPRFSQNPPHHTRVARVHPCSSRYKSLVYDTSRALSRLVAGGGGKPRLPSFPPRLPTDAKSTHPEKSCPRRSNSAYFGFVSETLNVNETYLSLQGESTFAGLPCIFVRLTACNLRCSYCDSAYAFTEGKKQSLDDIRAEIDRLAKPFRESRATPSPLAPRPPVAPKHREGGSPLPLVELTGGEPLLQKNALPLMAGLCDAGYTVLLETSGAHDISAVDPRVRRIMDLKCPSSGEVERNRWENLAHLKNIDEIKFVIGTVEDYAWVKEQIAKHKLDTICPLLVSWVHPLAPEQRDKSLKQVPAGQTPITRLQLVEQIIADALPLRFQAQLHKIIWPPEQRGV
jgi:7-carboxy-7-deazaguanine synthase